MIFHDMWKLYEKYVTFWDTALLVHLLLVMAAFILQWQY